MDQLDPLLPLSSPPATPSYSSTSNPNKPHSEHPIQIAPFRRLATILSLLLLALWANYEASKGFDLTVLNASSGTPAARRFNLLFVANGRAAAMALQSSRLIERIIYPDGRNYPRKHVRRVTIRLTDRNITDDVVVVSGYSDDCDDELVCNNGEYLIEISSSVMMQRDCDLKVVLGFALHRGMARVWLHDGHGTAPREITDSLVEYLSLQYYKIPRNKTAGVIIRKCEERNEGFVARLNNALLDKWDEHSVTEALRSPSDIMCLAQIVPGLKAEFNQAME